MKLLKITHSYYLDVERVEKGDNNCVFNVLPSKMNRNLSHYLKTQQDSQGYLYVLLKVNGKLKQYYIHRIIGTILVPNDNPLVKTQINHLDEDKSNNDPSNLVWCTAKENCNHGSRNKRISEGLKRYHSKRKKMQKLIDALDDLMSDDMEVDLPSLVLHRNQILS